MKKILIVLALCLIPCVAYATTVDTKASGDTVAFRSISWISDNPLTFGATPTIVTFNTVTKHIRLTNLSSFYDCYVDLTCKSPVDNSTGYISTRSSVVLVPAIGGGSPNTVELDFATKNLGFIGSTGSGHTHDQRIHYLVTGDWGDF